MVGRLTAKGFHASRIPPEWIPPSIFADIDGKGHGFSWAEKGHISVNQAKAFIIRQILGAGISVMMIDADISFLRQGGVEKMLEPLRGGKDFVGTLEGRDDMFFKPHVNGGLFAMRATDRMRELVEIMAINHLRSPAVNDQILLNQILDNWGCKINFPNEGWVHYQHDHEFGNGDNYIRNDWIHTTNPYTLHANYVVGLPKKIAGLKNNKGWHLTPAEERFV